jgi:membrane peptidoglycan carboxypeptidase
MPCAGKTGTTNESKDGWFVGYTPYYTTSVWVGYDDPRTLTGLTGASYPGQIWHSFMATIHDGLQPISFTDAITVMNNGNAWNTIVSTPEEQTVEESGATSAENTTDTTTAPTGEGNTTEGQAPAGDAENAGNAGNATHAGDATTEEHNGDIDNGIAEGTVVP